MTVRLQKYLADSGIASRRKAEELIKKGEVQVNGVITDTLGARVNIPADIVTYNGCIVKPVENKVYIMLNKPEGCITSAKDQFGRLTVIDLINVKERIVPVGRLDYDTSGLLLLTNDGELLFMLTHPKHNIKKTYIALVEGIPTEPELNKLRNGLIIDGYKTSGAHAEIRGIHKTICELEITIHEGRNRQVRKMCDEIGHKIIKLKRVKIGNITLGSLKEGEYRPLTEREIEGLRVCCKTKG